MFADLDKVKCTIFLKRLGVSLPVFQFDYKMIFVHVFHFLTIGMEMVIRKHIQYICYNLNIH